VKPKFFDGEFVRIRDEEGTSDLATKFPETLGVVVSSYSYQLSRKQEPKIKCLVFAPIFGITLEFYETDLYSVEHTRLVKFIKVVQKKIESIRKVGEKLGIFKKR
jgi:hypothetical protein